MANTDIKLASIGRASDFDSRCPSIKADTIEATGASEAQNAQGPSSSTENDLNADRLQRRSSGRMNETSLKPVDKGFGAWSFVRMHIRSSLWVDLNNHNPVLTTAGRSYVC